MKMHNDPKRVMGLIGVHMQEQIVQSINTWSDPPNSAYTIAKKGFDKPLVERGIMMRSIKSEVGEGED